MSWKKTFSTVADSGNSGYEETRGGRDGNICIVKITTEQMEEADVSTLLRQKEWENKRISIHKNGVETLQESQEKSKLSLGEEFHEVDTSVKQSTVIVISIRRQKRMLPRER